MNGNRQPRASKRCARRGRKSEARRKSQFELGTARLTRTRALLLAALRVWELKNRISD